MTIETWDESYTYKKLICLAIHQQLLTDEEWSNWFTIENRKLEAEGYERFARLEDGRLADTILFRKKKNHYLPAQDICF